jgi:branched-chain amino acid transport system permease protein
MGRAIRLVFLALVFLFLAPAVAGAQEDGGEAIRAFVQNQREEEGERVRDPVEGAEITVVDSSGERVGSGTTGEDGRVVIPVPAPGQYSVRLDEGSLPGDQTLTEGTGGERTVSVRPGATFNVNFFTGDSSRQTEGFWEQLVQRVFDGLRLGLVIAMCSVGLSLIFGTTGLTNFAHGEMVTFGAMAAFLLNVSWGVPLLIAAPLAVAIGGVGGWILDWGLWARLRRRGVGLVSQLVVSVGLSILLRYVFLYFFGGRTRQYGDFSLQEGIEIGPITATPRDLVTSVIALVVLLATALSLQRTRLGKATRAVADNVDLASASGIDSQHVIRIVWVAAGALAALGGIIRGLDEQVGFEMGANILFLMFAGVTLGGLGSAYGALVGGFIVGIVVEVSTLFGVPNELKATPALFMLIIVLLLRPQGILGRKERVG